MTSILQICWGLFYSLRYGPSWYMFHELLQRMCIMLFGDGTFNGCWFELVGWWCCWVFLRPWWPSAQFSQFVGVECWNLAVRVDVCFQFYWSLPHVFSALLLGTHTLRIAMPSCLIEPFVIMWYIFLSFNVTLPDTNIGTLASFWLVFTCYFFSILLLSTWLCYYIWSDIS